MKIKMTHSFLPLLIYWDMKGHEVKKKKWGEHCSLKKERLEESAFVLHAVVPCSSSRDLKRPPLTFKFKGHKQHIPDMLFLLLFVVFLTMKIHDAATKSSMCLSSAHHTCAATDVEQIREKILNNLKNTHIYVFSCMFPVSL